jgi:hypothetical protein
MKREIAPEIIYTYNSVQMMPPRALLSYISKPAVTWLYSSLKVSMDKFLFLIQYVNFKNSIIAMKLA